MKDTLKKVLEIVFFIFVLALSVVVFIFRERIGQIGLTGYLGLFVLCFLANSTVLLPAPSLMIAASAALIMNPYIVAVVAALGSSLGEFVGYAFGHATKDLSPKFEKFLSFLKKKLKKDEWIVFVLAVLPLPLFDIVGIYSGGTRMNLFKFFILCFLGKLVKMLVYVHLYDIIDWYMGVYGRYFDITSFLPEFHLK